MKQEQDQERITCPVHKKRLLARCDEAGVWLWCKNCLKEHHFTWQQLKQEVSQAQTAR